MSHKTPSHEQSGPISLSRQRAIRKDQTLDDFDQFLEEYERFLGESELILEESNAKFGADTHESRLEESSEARFWMPTPPRTEYARSIDSERTSALLQMYTDKA